MKWFYKDDSGAKHGPFSDDQVREFLAGENPGLVVDPPERIVIPINDCEYGMIWFKAGKFLRRGPIQDFYDPDFDEAEVGKSYEITISQGFWLLETPVTQAMWSSVMGTNPSYFKGEDLPVEHVSWFDCKAFIEKLNQAAPCGWSFRLPTEAEWQYASDPASVPRPENEYWYKGNSEGKTHPVKIKLPNVRGLYDMFGNVWEWCEDWSDEYPKGNLVDPKGPDSGTERVACGGCWNTDLATDIRCESSKDDPVGSSYALGFRLASSTPEK